jgi:transposase
MSNILEAGKLDFFSRQAQRRLEKEFLAYDTTSITSTSELIKSARYGVNKDHDDLAQVNLALLFGEKSLLPVYYRVLPGNISDVTTINKLSKDLTFLNIKNLKLVLDRGFYSEKNIDKLYISNYEFILSMKQNIKFVKECLDLSKDEIKLYSHHDKIFDMHHCMYEYEWNFSIINNKKQVTKNVKKLYVHVYYNRNKETTEYNNFNKKLIKIQDKITNKETLTEKEKIIFHKFFEIYNTQSKIKVKFNEKLIQEHTKYLGYFVLLSNKIKDSSIVLTYYRQRDVVEKAFDNLKDKLEMKRTLVHSDMAFNGKCFINFLALIYISYIHKQMLENNLYKNYTMSSLLDDLEVIELYEYDSMPAHYSDINKKQIEIYAKLGVQPPNLCIKSGA